MSVRFTELSMLMQPLERLYVPQEVHRFNLKTMPLVADLGTCANIYSANTMTHGWYYVISLLYIS